MAVTDLDLFRHNFGPAGKHPRIALVAGLATDEFNGTFVLARLVDYLRGVAEGTYPRQKLRHRALIVLSSPSRDGMQTQRCIDDIVESTRRAYYRVAISASSSTLEELPQACLYACSDDERASAFLFGLPAIIEHPTHTLADGALVEAWQSLGGENFFLHAGQLGYLQPQHCERLFRALISFLDRTGTVEGIELSEEEADTHHFGVHQTLSVLAEASGFFVSRLEVGRWVQAGESVGLIYDRLRGMLTTEIKAPVNGLVSALRRHPLLLAGDLVARIQTRDPLPVASREKLLGFDHRRTGDALARGQPVSR
ncbi:MAG: succinylglutamate desuccinylase [Gammaproteobacteria bacterium]